MRIKCSRVAKSIFGTCIVLCVLLKAKMTFHMDNGLTNTSMEENSLDRISGNDVRALTNTSQLPPPQRHTSPVYHVGFLKVHKAGSTTMQNLLFRFAIRHNLTVLLPRTGNYFLSTGAAMPLKKGNHYDIFACHTVFSAHIFGLLPSDSVKVGIIRDPLERSISAAYYYRDVFGTAYLRRIPSGSFIETLVSSPEKYDPSQFSYTRNSMGKDFGFPAGLRYQPEKINTHLTHLKKQFELVLVMERFEESLVLLKRHLNWSLQDIVFLPTNSHKHKPVNLTREEKIKFRDTNFLDYTIYDTFYPIFDDQVKSEGPSFQEELAHFKSVLSSVKVFCSQGVDSALLVPESKWYLDFKVLRRDCELMKKDEIVFIKELRGRHNSMQN